MLGAGALSPPAAAPPEVSPPIEASPPPEASPPVEESPDGEDASEEPLLFSESPEEAPPLSGVVPVPSGLVSDWLPLSGVTEPSGVPPSVEVPGSVLSVVPPLPSVEVPGSVVPEPSVSESPDSFSSEEESSEALSSEEPPDVPPPVLSSVPAFSHIKVRS